MSGHVRRAEYLEVLRDLREAREEVRCHGRPCAAMRTCRLAYGCYDHEAGALVMVKARQTGCYSDERWTADHRTQPSWAPTVLLHAARSAQS